MPDMTVSRKQRLRTLEKEIRSGMEEFYYTGMKLKEIRDDELYKEDGFDTWERYCKERWEWGSNYVSKLIKASEYREKLPDLSGNRTSSTGSHPEWSEATVRELTRIDDKRDAARVAAKVVKAVEQSEKEASRNPDVKPLKLTASVVRKFVDEDLGVDRAAKSQQTKRQREEESKPELRQFLVDLTGRIEAETEKLEELPMEAWTLLSEDSPKVVKRLIAACESLAGLLRKVQQ